MQTLLDKVNAIDVEILNENEDSIVSNLLFKK